jgi:hypothetical protein
MEGIMKISTTVICLGLAISLSGCASLFQYRPYARTVKKQPSKGGIIALNVDHRGEDEDLAKSMMQQNCGSLKAVVTEENEVVVGSVTNSKAEKFDNKRKKEGTFLGMDVVSGNDGETQTSSETTQKKEWQMIYECRS